MNRLVVTLLFLCSYVMALLAQTVDFDLPNRELYLAKVKMVDEFMARFNGDECRQDVSPGYSNRENGILLLFDLSKFNSKSDSDFVAAAEFAKEACAGGARLSFGDEGWFAKVKCHGLLGRKDVVFDMFLCVEERDSSMYKWAVCDVDGEAFLTSRDRPHREMFILPNDNEQFFRSVRKITSETPQYVDDYVKKGFKAEQLSTFLALVRCGFLKIEAVSDVEFVFTQVPGYVFRVKYFNRESKNSGWLIDSVEKVADLDKLNMIGRLRR